MRGKYANNLGDSETASTTEQQEPISKLVTASPAEEPCLNGEFGRLGTGAAECCSLLRCISVLAAVTHSEY